MPARWRALLRLARRDAWRAKGRSLLVVALIGLPVAVICMAHVVWRTFQLDPSEIAERRVGAADARIYWYGGGKVNQTPSGEVRSVHEQGPVPTAPPAEPTGPPTDISPLLPTGTRILTMQEIWMQVRTDAGRDTVQLRPLDLRDPLLTGTYRLLDGRLPTGSEEVVLSASLAKSIGATLGDPVEVINANRSLTVVGLVDDARDKGMRIAHVLPGNASLADPSLQGPSTWLVDTPEPVTWAQVREFNAKGFVVLSRHVLLDPPPDSDLPKNVDPVPVEVIVGVTLIAGLAALEIVLLAGPAFAVGARRQRRDLALLAAVGGRPRDLRNLVLASGVVLGGAAGLSAVAIGILAAIGGRPIGERVSNLYPGHFDVRPLELAAVGLLAVLTALAAAYLPARAAGHTDVTAALAGRRGTVRSHPAVPVVGVAIAGTGAAVAVLGGAATTNPTVILGGIALVEIGLIVATPALIGLATRGARFLPLAGRIALRDAGRNRASAAPAVAAVMASVIGSVAVAIGINSYVDREERMYQAQLADGDAVVRLWSTELAHNADGIAAALRATLPARDVAVLRGSGPPMCISRPDNTPCRGTGVEVDEAYMQWDPSLGTPPPPTSRATQTLSGTLVDDGSHADLIFATSAPEVTAALRDGKAVVPDEWMVKNGRVDVVLYDNVGMPDGGYASPAAPRKASVPAVSYAGGIALTRLILPPSIAADLGVTATPIAVLADTTRTPTDTQRQAANEALAALKLPNTELYVERGYVSDAAPVFLGIIGVAALITIGAASIATALANVDGRGDLTTLGAIGAAPRVRRMLSVGRAGVIAGLGTALGVVAGFVPAYAYINTLNRDNVESYFPGGLVPDYRFVVPWWPNMLVTAVVVPLVAMLVAGLFTRSRLPSERPAD